MEKKSFNTPDQTMPSPKAKAEIVTVAGHMLARLNFEPGWKWSVDVGPAAGTASCQMHHLICLVAGRLKIVMDDGTELEAGAGDVVDIPAGHDAWVIGDQTVVGIDAGGIISANVP